MTGKDQMTAKDQAENLLNKLLAFAEQMLESHGELFPLAGVIDKTGTSKHLVVGGNGQAPGTAEAIKRQLMAGLREQVERGQCQLAVLVTCESITDPDSGQVVDLIHAAAEHQQGYAADIYLPYTIDNGTLQYGESISQDRSPELFTGDGSTNAPFSQ